LSRILRLLTLVAVLLMPFGMASAAAHRVTAAPMQHCPQQGSNHPSKGTLAECTMACSAALPAAERAGNEPVRIISAPMVAALPPRLHGLHPETATPPPKRS
jgi:hypothetical protein